MFSITSPERNEVVIVSENIYKYKKILNADLIKESNKYETKNFVIL